MEGPRSLSGQASVRQSSDLSAPASPLSKHPVEDEQENEQSAASISGKVPQPWFPDRIPPLSDFLLRRAENPSWVGNTLRLYKSREFPRLCRQNKPTTQILGKMPDKILDDISHRRYNPLRGSWILVSPHRTKRPWQGQQESPGVIDLPEYDPKCYLCPGNTRASGDANPNYDNTFVFVNDYSAVKNSQDDYSSPDEPGSLPGLLLQAEPVKGKCYVLTFSAAHNFTLADMSPAEILPIVKTWTEIYTAHLSPKSPLASLAKPTHLPPSNPHADVGSPSEQYRWMQIFENKGAAMGCSNPHPHGQIWTTTSLPEEPRIELEQLRKYNRQQGGGHMLVDYARLEREKNERVVFQNDTFLVVCPWWATWPFETMILPVKHIRSLIDLSEKEQSELAEAIAEVTRRYDNLFETSFPYSMGIHQAPLEGNDEEIHCSSLHLHFYPPLLRSATVRKFLVGYEMLGEPQRDITPEQATVRLQNCGGELYRKKLQPS